MLNNDLEHGNSKIFGAHLKQPIEVSASRIRNVPGVLLASDRSASARRIIPQNQSWASSESAGAT